MSNMRFKINVELSFVLQGIDHLPFEKQEELNRILGSKLSCCKEELELLHEQFFQRRFPGHGLTMVIPD